MRLSDCLETAEFNSTASNDFQWLQSSQARQLAATSPCSPEELWVGSWETEIGPFLGRQTSCGLKIFKMGSRASRASRGVLSCWWVSCRSLVIHTLQTRWHRHCRWYPCSTKWCWRTSNLIFNVCKVPGDFLSRYTRACQTLPNGCTAA